MGAGAGHSRYVYDTFLLADPLRAMNTWYLLASVGFVMIGVVFFAEWRRQQIPQWAEEWRLRLETWD